jgi:hypothetical protein
MQPQQQLLPLEPQPPSPAQVHAELVRQWRSRLRWQQRWASVEDLLARAETARALQACARQLLLQRQREGLRRQRTTP